MIKRIRGHATAVQRTGENGQAYVRFLHTVPTVPPIDIYADGNLLTKELSYGNYTQYYPLKSGNVLFTLYRAGTNDDIIGIVNFNIPDSGLLTIAGIGVPNRLGIFQIPDHTPPQSSNASSFLRFVNLSPDAPPLDVIPENGQMLFQNIAYKDISIHRRLKPGEYSLGFYVSASGLRLFPLQKVNLEPGKLYTVYTIGYASERTKRKVVLLPDGIISATQV